MLNAFEVESILRSLPNNEHNLELGELKDAIGRLEAVESEAQETVMKDIERGYREVVVPDVSMADVENSANEGEASNYEKFEEVDKNNSNVEDGVGVLPCTSKAATRWRIPSATQLGAEQAVGPVYHRQLGDHLPFVAPWYNNFPYVVSTYFQLAFNVWVFGLIAWGMTVFKRDVDIEMNERSEKIAREAAHCADEYVQNECHNSHLRPALREFCAELEACMDRNPAAVRRWTAHAATLAGTINEFFDPLSFKSLFLLCLFAVAVVFCVNYVFGFLRAKSYNLKRQEILPANHSLKAKKSDIWRHN